MPTLLGLAGLQNKITKEVEGHNLAKNLQNVIETESGPKSALILLPKSRGVINGQYTLGVEDLEAGNKHQVFLYDNVNDPYQLTRLSISNKPSISKKLLKDLRQFLKETNDPWYQEKRFSNSIIYP